MNDYLWILVIGLIIGGIYSALQIEDKKKKFSTLGNVIGKTKEEILRHVGSPNSINYLPDGEELLQWITINATGSYHIAMVFKDNVCQGITHESETKP